MGDSTVQASGQLQDLGRGGAGCAPEFLRSLLNDEIRTGGAGFFGSWRPEFTSRTGFTAIATNTNRDIGPCGKQASSTQGSVAGGGYEDLTGDIAATPTHIMKFAAGTAVSGVTHFDIVYIGE